MGFEIPLDADYPDHPKALKMIALLGKQGDIYPIRLWCWCAKYAKNGIVNGGQDEIEKAVKWTGEAGKCHAAMIAAGILKKDGKTVHDWMHHAGRKIAAYEKKKENQRVKYDRDSSGNLPDSSGRIPESSGTPAGILPTPNETKRNEKKRNETKREETAQVSELSVAQLASDAAFDEGWGTDPKRISLWQTQLADLVIGGKSLEFLAKELETSPNSEPPWEFSKRIGGNKSKAEPETREQRLAAEQAELKRQHERMGNK